jgi:hypothetical protein
MGVRGELAFATFFHVACAFNFLFSGLLLFGRLRGFTGPQIACCHRGL